MCDVRTDKEWYGKMYQFTTVRKGKQQMGSGSVITHD